MSARKCYQCKRKYPFNRSLICIKRIEYYSPSSYRFGGITNWKCANCGYEEERVYGNYPKDIILKKGTIIKEILEPLEKIDYNFKCPKLPETEV